MEISLSLDANEDLSIQVHPDKKIAQQIGNGARCKTEAWYTMHTEPNSMMYCFIENEAKLSSDLLFELKTSRTISIYSGVGINTSASFNNKLLIMEDYDVNLGVVNEFTPNGGVNENKLTLAGKDVIYTRAYLPMGVNLKLYKNLASTFEVKLGYGLEKVVGGNLSGFRTREVSFGLKYNFTML